MKISTVIEVQAYGDFDVKQTNCIMVHEDKLNVSEVLKEFHTIQGINSNSGLSSKILRTIIDDFIFFLELKGFNKLKTKEICFSD